MNWYTKCWKESFNFSGRARRKEYWMFVLFNSLIGWLFAFLSSFSQVAKVVYVLYALAIIPANLAVTFRRLHDTNHSGWNLFYADILPFIVCVPLGLFFMLGIEPGNALIDAIRPWAIFGMLIFGLLALVLNLRIFYLTLKPGDVGANDYGDDPIGDPNRKPSSTAGCFIAFVAVILLCVVLLALLLPALGAARSHARDIACINNMKNVGVALTIYAADNRDFLPTDPCIENLEGWEEIKLCPDNESNAPYRLLDSACGMNLKELKTPSTRPLVLCTHHGKYVHLLFADGHVEAILKDEIPDETRLLIDSIEEQD